MNSISENTPSTFALLVDKLRDKSEEELKQLYLHFSSKELADEWSSITESSNFGDASEEDIIQAITRRRYNSTNV